jgi:AcrR family transcriptional regulator
LPKTTTHLSKAKRLTREQSQAQTRARLIEVGRRHFLRYGLGGAVAEKIAADAGYTRGALYANFEGKEGLFLSVIHEQKMHHFEVFRAILGKKHLSATVRLQKFRSAYVDILTDRDWIVLYTEFEAEALRNERVRSCIQGLHRGAICDGIALIEELLASSEIKLKMTPKEFLIVMHNFSTGMAINQKIMGTTIPKKCARQLILSLFDSLISSTK